MATAKTTIELNGKLYDARTGKIIGESKTPLTPKLQHRTNGAVLDGFVRRAPASGPVALAPKPKIARTTPQHTRLRLEKSKTLMRPAVKKPKVAATHPTSQSMKHTHFKKEDPMRQARASQTPRSNHIQRFNPNTSQHKIVKKKAVLSVATPVHSAANQQLAGRVAHLATSTEAHVRQSVDVIEESLRNASSHLQTFEDNVRESFWKRFGFKNKTANLASMSFAAVLLCGFFAYQNAPNVEMRVAATRAGVSAHMPGYSPAGFSAVRGIQAEPGKVTVAFKSNTNDKAYKVTQQASSWSSDTLLSNHVAASKTPYQTYQDEGKTVYIYNNSNATWVNGGIWYRVDGDASLTSDQLLRIANSL